MSELEALLWPAISPMHKNSAVEVISAEEGYDLLSSVLIKHQLDLRVMTVTEVIDETHGRMVLVASPAGDLWLKIKLGCE